MLRLVWNTDWLTRLSSVNEFVIGDLFVNRRAHNAYTGQVHSRAGWLWRIKSDDYSKYCYHIRWSNEWGEHYVTTHSYSDLCSLITQTNIDYYAVKKPLGK